MKVEIIINGRLPVYLNSNVEIDGKRVVIKQVEVFEDLTEIAGLLVDKKVKHEVVKWENGERCDYKNENDEWSYGGRYVCYDDYAKHHVFYATDMTLYHASSDQIRKPESPQQKLERERLEAAYDLYCDVSKMANRGTYTFEQFCDESLTDYKIDYLAIVDKTNYRKGE